MKNLKELQLELTELTKTKIEIQQDASSEVNIEINRVKAEIDHIKVELQKNSLGDFKQIYSIIEEMSRMSFELYVEKMIDIEFRVVNHVQWVEFILPKSHQATRCKYASIVDGIFIPHVEELKASRSILTEFYDEKG